jgi:hypothetical protein
MAVEVALWVRKTCTVLGAFQCFFYSEDGCDGFLGRTDGLTQKIKNIFISYDNVHLTIL